MSTLNTPVISQINFSAKLFIGFGELVVYLESSEIFGLSSLFISSSIITSLFISSLPITSLFISSLSASFLFITSVFITSVFITPVFITSLFITSVFITSAFIISSLIFLTPSSHSHLYHLVFDLQTP